MANRKAYGNNDWGILHVNAVKARVTGSGNLLLLLSSLSNINNLSLTPIAMVGATAKEPVQLTNFTDQRVQLQGTTINSGDNFFINRITIYYKPVATGFPQ